MKLFHSSSSLAISLFASSPLVVLLQSTLSYHPMESMQEIMPPQTPIQSDTMSFSDCITPPALQHTDENSQNSGNTIHKTITRDRLKVPKAFKFPERYTSPTDKIMSPVTKGLLARNRKGSSLLPPSKNLLKPTQDSGLAAVECGIPSKLKYDWKN